MIKESKKLKLPADLFSRNTLYGLLANFILQKRQPEEQNRSLDILDVGGYQGKLSWFMPQHTKITVLDQKPAPDIVNTNYVQADASQLPFDDGSFDLILSSDLLEHVAPENRSQVILEMIRVSKRYVILAAPFDSILTQKAEEFINQQFREYTGSNHPFLIEHLENGLPDLESVEELLGEQKLNFVKIGEGNIFNWYLQQLSAGAKVKHQDLKTFNEFFNQHLFQLGNFRSPTYRTVLFIDKQNQLDAREVQELIEEHNNFHTATYLEAYKKAFDELQTILNQKDQQIVAREDLFLQQIQSFEEKLNQSAQQFHAQENQIKLLHSQINEVQAIINERETEITLQRQSVGVLQVQNNELNQIIQSQRDQLALLDTQVRSQDLLLGRLKQELESTQKSEQELTNLIILKEQGISEKSQEINNKNQQISMYQTSLAEYKQELEKVLASRSWKLVRLYGKVKNALYTRPKYLLQTSWQIISKMGLGEFFKRLKRKLFKKFSNVPDTTLSDYQRYVEQIALTAHDHRRIKSEIAAFEYKPLISIVVPVYNVDEVWLRKAIDSVLNQLYEKWELCLVDDASTDPKIKPILHGYQQLDSRIKVNFRPHNGGIVKATNSALKMAQGAYIALMDNDDEITHDALYEIVKALQTDRYDLIYSDEDKLEINGQLCEPFFKPDFNPDLLLSCNYISHLGAYRRKIVEEIGGFREGLDGSQDYDLILRFTDKPRKIHHIRKVLYHWRKIPGSTAASVDAKPYAFVAAKKALTDAIKRRSIKAEVLDGVWKGSYRLKREIVGEPLVSIIIPFRDMVGVLKICIDSIFAKTTYQNYEILLVNNSSELLETRQYMREIENCPRVRLLHYNAPFNFSAINNFANLKAKGEYLILLNNDTEVIEPDWIQNMLEHAQRPEVGAVGAKLLYPTGQIQHAGVIIGISGVANHAFSKRPGEEQGYFGMLNIVRDYSAVTAACIMIKKSVYEEMDGLDEENLAVAFNDVDFCLRLGEKGLLVVYTPYALLYHHESLSRGYNVNFNEEFFLRRRHAGIIQNGDPNYNPNLTQERLDFSLKVSDKVQ